MSNDFYSSPQGAMAMHGAGRNLGHDEGWRVGYDEGVAEGIRQANAVSQPQINRLANRIRELEANTWTDRAKRFELIVVALSAVEALGSASQEQHIAFVKAYLRLSKEATDKKLLAMTPDANPEFARAHPDLAKFVNTTFATAMQQRANHSPSP
jgi:hypothetical protein